MREIEFYLANGCYQCNWTGYLEARDERGLTVTWPCDCRNKKKDVSSAAEESRKEK